MLGRRLSDDPGAFGEGGAVLADAVGPAALPEAQYRRRVLPGLFDRLARRCAGEIAGAGA
ncbi:MAG: hypothetical protein F4070_13965 [Acidimicrobiales bacterium]|nr:hypothetical protein [Acidimicrobiales bacterium]